MWRDNKHTIAFVSRYRVNAGNCILYVSDQYSFVNAMIYFKQHVNEYTDWCPKKLVNPLTGKRDNSRYKFSDFIMVDYNDRYGGCGGRRHLEEEENIFKHCYCDKECYFWGNCCESCKEYYKERKHVASFDPDIYDKLFEMRKTMTQQEYEFELTKHLDEVREDDGKEYMETVLEEIETIKKNQQRFEEDVKRLELEEEEENTEVEEEEGEEVSPMDMPEESGCEECIEDFLMIDGLCQELTNNFDSEDKSNLDETWVQQIPETCEERCVAEVYKACVGGSIAVGQGLLNENLASGSRVKFAFGSLLLMGLSTFIYVQYGKMSPEKASLLDDEL